MRAWLRIDTTVTPGTAPVDGRGCLMLGIEPGKSVILRPLTVSKVTPSAPGSGLAA
ncbi:MAG: hypothetical protein P8N43_07310 [Alphaproteobacteria bacterium]|nr:hypothetical protein [Alphaproteobacteria bacterium]